MGVTDPENYPCRFLNLPFWSRYLIPKDALQKALEDEESGFDYKIWQRLERERNAKREDEGQPQTNGMAHLIGSWVLEDGGFKKMIWDCDLEEDDAGFKEFPDTFYNREWDLLETIMTKQLGEPGRDKFLEKVKKRAKSIQAYSAADGNVVSQLTEFQSELEAAYMEAKTSAPKK